MYMLFNMLLLYDKIFLSFVFDNFDLVLRKIGNKNFKL